MCWRWRPGEPARREIAEAEAAAGPVLGLGQVGRDLAREQHGLAALVAQAPAHAGERLAVVLGAHHVGRAQGRERQDLDLDPREPGGAGGGGDQQLEELLQVGVLVVGHVVGLAGGEQHLVDPGREQAAEEAGLAVAEAPQDHRQRQPRVGEVAGAGVEAGEQVDQHDLAVEAAEMLLVEAADHLLAIGLEARRPSVPGWSPAAPARRQRAEAQHVGPASSPGLVKRPGWTSESRSSWWQRRR